MSETYNYKLSPQLIKVIQLYLKDSSDVSFIKEIIEIEAALSYNSYLVSNYMEVSKNDANIK